MNDTTHFINALRGLNDLENPRSSGWVQALSPSERRLAIERFREILPVTLLAHHDRRIARKKRSLAEVRNGVCGACHLQLPSGHHRSRSSAELDVCDNCGVFLEWPACVASPAPKRRGTATVS